MKPISADSESPAQQKRKAETLIGGLPRLGIAAFTPRGMALSSHLQELLRDRFILRPYRKEEQALKQWCGGLFAEHAEGIVFIGAAGIAVRQIAPYLKSKTEDPAVVVIDEAGQFVISLLSGHIGGANELTLTLSRLLAATPVITTATDVNHKFAVDVFAVKNHLRIGSMKAAKEISASILRKEPVYLVFEGQIDGKIPEELNRISPFEAEKLPETVCQIRICPEPYLSSYDETGESDSIQQLYLYYRPYILGIGCRKGKSFEEIRAMLQRVLAEKKISPNQILLAASIDLKKEEKGILELCARWGLPFQVYTAEELKAVPGEYSASAFVSSVTGVDNVCERSARLAAGSGAEWILRKTAENGVTAALAERKVSVYFE